MDDILHLWKLKIFAEQCIFLCEVQKFVGEQHWVPFPPLMSVILDLVSGIFHFKFKSRKNPEQLDLAGERTATLCSHTT